MAITSMILGILAVASCVGFVFGIPAIILGHVAHNQARRSPAQYAGGGMAITGFVTGYVSLLMSLLIFAFVLPQFSPKKEQLLEINSETNLKQIGMAFRIWEGDHGGQFPFNVSQAQGGTKELCNRDGDGFEKDPTAIFMVMSNELSTPAILFCLNDPIKQCASDFQNLTANNISYKVRSGPNVCDSNPHEILAVDPINGLVLYCDGSVARDRKFKQEK